MTKEEIVNILKDCEDSRESINNIADRLLALQKWIPVTEQLPENNNLVFACDEQDVFIVRYNVKDNHWTGYENKGYFRKFKPTHWMSLPNLPKEKK